MLSLTAGARTPYRIQFRRYRYKSLNEMVWQNTYSMRIYTKVDLCAQGKHPSARLIGIAGDVGSKEGTDAFCAAVDALDRPLDVLVNNVGIFAVKDFWDITDDEWQHTFDVNFFSNVRLCRHFLQPMLKRNQVCYTPTNPTFWYRGRGTDVRRQKETHHCLQNRPFLRILERTSLLHLI